MIRFGKAGKTLAGALGDAGWRVAMIEASSRMYGGTCINIACIPTKTLLHDAVTNVPYSHSVGRKDNVTAILREKNFNLLNDRKTVDVFTGTARFLNDHDIRITSGADALAIRGEKIFINTGAEPFLPAIEGMAASARVFTSTTLMGFQPLPRRLAIIGSGSVGLEFATTYAKFGSQVTVFVRSSRLLNKEDDDVAAAVQTELEQTGIRFLFNTTVQRVVDDPSGNTRIHYRTNDGPSGQLDIDAVLVATGRRPVTEDLDLEAAGVEADGRGFVQVDETLRTSVPHIWALGDVNGGPQFTYISLDDYRIVEDALLGEGKRSTRDRQAVPYTIFLDPPLARVGITETKALQAGQDISVAKLPVAAIPRAHVGNDTRGLLKAVVDRQTRRILGASLFCENAEEVINIISLAMSLDQDYTALRDRIYTHPTMSEALNDLFSQIQSV